jgi:TP901 family phage tail tape measure protein
MADENIVTNIVANADFSGLIADVNKVTASLSKLQAQLIASDAKLANQVAVMNRSFSENLRRTGQFSTHFVTLTSDTEKFGKSLDSGKLKLRDYFRTFQEHTKTSGGIVRDLARQQVALQNAIIQPLGKNAQGLMQFNVQVPQGLDNIKNKTAIARQELQILNKVVQDGGVQLINWGKNTQWAGRQLTVGLTVPLAAFGKAAADAFRMADAELTRLTKVYGGVAATSSAELSKIRAEVSATAAEIAKGYGISFKETIALAADIAATGKTGNELLSSVKETSRLAVLGEVDRQDAMKATLAIQTTFKQNTDQLAESINFLNSVENQTSTSLADLVEAIPKAGPVMQGLGGDVKDLALYLTAMKEGGINASEGANALKSALASLINPTKVATEKFAAMGIDLGGIVTQNAGNLTGTIMALQSALDNLDPLQKQQAIEQLFGKFQFARMNALFANLGKQGSQTLQVMDLMKASSQELANVAGRELSMVTESASGKYNRAVQGLKADLAGIGEEFLKVQTFFINVIDGIIDFTTNLPKPIKQILTFAGGLTAIIGPVIMLTGVLANFFGYVIKGVSHFKALFKGGEGWKMLTPEILAAQKAGSLVEQTFYSDAQAATVLKTAIEGLVAEFTVLQTKAQSGAISVAPALNNFVNGVTGRVVNPNHPMLSPTDTRSMSHMNPVGGMTADQKTGQTIFGVVPGAPRVNQTIGNNPQIYANADLPDVPGLTRIGKASTGVVAAEAAKWHAMTGALAMQSEEEIKALKMEVGRTGLITHELSASYQALLPEMTKLTQKAALESAEIVAQLQASKITIDQARAKIITLNAQIEAAMGAAATDIAGLQGRSISLTSVPLLSQPVVDRAGKSNMKELARPGRTRGLLNKIAGGLGVKTFGAPYSIETTMPKRFEKGGTVYLAEGDEVFAPKGTDTVPAMLTAGEYVVNRKATGENLQLLEQINSGKSLPAIIEDIVSQYPNAVNPSQFEAAHASTSTPVTGAQLSAKTSLSGRPQALANAFPDVPIFEVKDSNTLELYRALNQAMKEGGAGATPGKLLSGIKNSMRMGKLFENLPTTNNKIRRTVYKELIKAVKSHKGLIMDRDFARIYDTAMINSIQKLPASDSMLLQKAVSLSSAPADIRIHSKNFKDLVKQSGATLEEMSAQDAMDAAEPGKPAFYKSEKSKSGKSGKNAVAIRTPGGWATQVRSGDTVTNSKAVTRAGRNSTMRSFANKMTEAIRFGQRGRQIIQQSPESIAMTARWKRGYAKGGLISSVGMPTQYFQDGSDGPVGFGSGFRSQTQKGYLGKGMMSRPEGGGLGMGAQMGIMMGGTMAGQAVGGNAGTAITAAANILPWLPFQKILPLLKSADKGAGALKNALTIAGKAAGLLTRMLPGAAVVGTLYLLYKGYQKWQKSIEDTRREHIMLNGITEKGAKEAGISYKNVGKSIEDVREQLKLQKEAGLSAYESMTPSGVGGLTLTIAQLKELKKTAKETMPELVGTFNSIDTTKVNDLAANLKAQFVAAGMSAQDATNKIYAIIEASNKAGAGLGAITSSGFTAITDKGSAAASIVKSLIESLADIENVDPKAFASNIDTVISSLDAATAALVGTKNSQGEVITESMAMTMQWEKLVKLGADYTKIGEKGLENLKKERPELAAILKSSDTIAGMYAKWRVLLAGVNIDLKNITSQQAMGIAAYEQALSAAAATATSNENTAGTLGVANKATNDLTESIKKGESAIKKYSNTEAGLSKARIKGYQDEIKAIRDRADEKKRALRATVDSENTELELQKLKLEAQSALARGDRDAYEAANIAISQLTKETQLKKAEEKIDANAKKEEAKIQAILDADQAKKDKAAAAVTAGQNNNASKGETLAQISNIKSLLAQLAIDQRETNLIKDPAKKAEDQKAIDGRLQTIVQTLEKSSDLVQKAFPEFVDSKTNKGKLGQSGGSYVGSMFVANGPGEGNQAFSKLVSEISVGAEKNFNKLSKEITGGASLKMVVEAMGGKVDKSKTIQQSDVTAAIKANQGSSSKFLTDQTKDDGSLEEGVRNAIIQKYGFKDGDSFTFQGKTYNVKNRGGILPGVNAVLVKKWGGGPVVAGQTYAVNDRINALGVQQEGFMPFTPKVSGMIYPNADTMPKYNIASGQVTGMSGGVNSSYNNNSYSINIALNGTNVTADDVMRRFKAEMALVHAKEGRSRSVGGQV